MAFDGTVVAGIRHEFDTLLTGGHISKIAQPEKDALILTIKNNGKKYMLLLSANAGLPLAYITEESKKAPLSAPNFCMLLRKHIGSGKILEITQPDFERAIKIKIEHLDEMGDMSNKYLVIELMGKYSNIILLNDDNTVLDSIKRVSALVSSVREVLPGKNYFIPAQEGRINPLSADEAYFKNVIAVKPFSVCKAIYTSLTGFSPVMANEICYLSDIDADLSVSALTDDDITELYFAFKEIMFKIKEGNFSPTVYYNEKGEPAEFSAFPLAAFNDCRKDCFGSFSELLEYFYGSKENVNRIRQKSADLRLIVTNAITRTANKIDIFIKQLKDTEKRDKYRIYGELITTYGYQATDGDKFLEATDYNTGKNIKIPLDTDIPVMANAKKYFDRYSKLKRTFDAVTVQLEEAKSELTHLDSIKASLSIAEKEEDLAEIRNELISYNYIKKHSSKKGEKIAKQAKSEPLHFISSDGFDIYVGKNNYQNDLLTFKTASSSDWWFHAKKCAGSHVILISAGKEIPDKAFEEAGKLAVHYSAANTSSSLQGNGIKHEVDYVMKKEVKKPNGAKPGFVVYYTNYSLIADSDISGLKQV